MRQVQMSERDQWRAMINKQGFKLKLTTHASDDNVPIAYEFVYFFFKSYFLQFIVLINITPNRRKIKSKVGLTIFE